ncbi:MAG: winged helix-turn-helix domain-containing protein [Oscillospiraceae bacterium]|jgi:DNA-binding SARP family transcriptional activator|nr:winged helix-turn-helix domain-containing protein [Oscillospiraceae bacterium]
MLNIRMFGEFTIKSDDFDISGSVNRSQRLRTMLAYLITHKDREIPQDELIEILWPEDDVDNPSNTLKTLLHRARAVLEPLGLASAQNVIKYRGGVYAWSPETACRTDTMEFEQLCAEAEALESDNDLKPELLLRAAALYRGDFLPKNALDLWVVPISSYYRSKYIKVVCTAADLLLERDRYEEIITLCQNAIRIDPYEEYFHQCLIRALIAVGRQPYAMTHYDYVTELFFSKFGVTPSHDLTALYKDIVKASKKAEINLGIIMDELREAAPDAGCYYCEYESFRTIYQLEARNSARTGQSVYVSLLTVSDSLGEQPKQRVLNRAITNLRETVSHSLRNGDLYTRYSASQYLVMLPTTSFETGRMVVRRITDAFRRDNPKLPVILSASLHPITPTALDKIV